MKRIIATISVFFVLALLFSACTTQVLIRFVDSEGEALLFEGTSFAQETAVGVSSLPEITNEAEPVTSIPTAMETGSSGEQNKVPLEPETAATTEQNETTSKEYILSLYRYAVNRVRNGEAGYHKKTWQSAQVSQMTGIAAVDSFINAELDKRATSEADAETEVFEKGTPDAVAFFPDCTLKDVGQIVSATSKAEGEKVILSIVMQDENTPESIENSRLGQITDIILFRNEIERNLKETLSVVSNYDYTIIYKGFEITCELTKDGRFLSLRHHAYADVHVATAQVLFLTLKNKDAVLIMDAAFSDFTY